MQRDKKQNQLLHGSIHGFSEQLSSVDYDENSTCYRRNNEKKKATLYQKSQSLVSYITYPLMSTTFVASRFVP